MQILKTTAKGKFNWQKLNLEQQYETASWLAGAIFRSNALGQISPDAVGIAAGPRQTAAKGGAKRHFKQVALLIDVISKKSRGRCGQNLIPETIQMRIPLEGRYMVLAVPTDIRVVPPMPIAQADPFKIKVRSQVGNPSVNGSLCALVKNRHGNESLRYILTCHHVAFLSLHDPNLAADLTAVCAHMKGDQIDSGMGKSTRPAKFSPNIPYSIDAGLVKLLENAEARNAGYWPIHPRGWIKKSHQIGTGFKLGCRVFNRRLAGAKTEFSALRFGFPVQYKGGGMTRFAQLIEYKLPDNFTKAGDSGGALIAKGKILVGMHIAGAGKMGYAIPAYHLMHSKAFTPSIELAQPV